MAKPILGKQGIMKEGWCIAIKSEMSFLKKSHIHR